MIRGDREPVIRPGATAQVVTVIKGLASDEVTYSADGGSVSSGGVFSATTPGTYKVTAIPTADPSQATETTITVVAPPTPASTVQVKSQLYIPPENPALGPPPVGFPPLDKAGNWVPGVSQWLQALYNRVGGANGTLVQTMNGRSGIISPDGGDYAHAYLGVNDVAVDSAKLNGQSADFYAVDAQVAHLATDETVTGIKTFNVAPVLKAGAVLQPGANFVFDADTGTMIGTSAAQKLAFFGKPPIVQPAALVATVAAAPAGGTGTAAGAWDTAAHRDTAIATINNLKTRLDALIINLQALGLNA